MILTAHQPVYLGGWLGHMAKIAAADLFCLFDCVLMEDSGFENRQRIKTPAGAQMLTVPVRRGRDVLVKDVAICNDQSWQRKHWRSIELAYAKAPHFERYAPKLREFYAAPQTWGFLSHLDLAMLRWFMAELGIKAPIVRASEYQFHGSKSALVLDMCQQLGASEFIFGEHGNAYADVAAFGRAGVKVRFQAYKHPEYRQLHGGFESHLSVLDALMNLGPDARRLIL